MARTDNASRVTANDIEAARRVYVDAIGTDREQPARAELLRLIAQAKAEKPWRPYGEA